MAEEIANTKNITAMLEKVQKNHFIWSRKIFLIAFGFLIATFLCLFTGSLMIDIALKCKKFSVYNPILYLAIAYTLADIGFIIMFVASALIAIACVHLSTHFSASRNKLYVAASSASFAIFIQIFFIFYLPFMALGREHNYEFTLRLNDLTVYLSNLFLYLFLSIAFVFIAIALLKVKTGRIFFDFFIILPLLFAIAFVVFTILGSIYNILYTILYGVGLLTTIGFQLYFSIYDITLWLRFSEN